MILETEAPITFRIPISLVRCSAVKDAKPNIPRHAMDIARMEKIMNSTKNLFSERYNASILSS